jgi:hypothetical protein
MSRVPADLECWAVGGYSGAGDPPPSYTPGAVGGAPEFFAQWSMGADSSWEVSHGVVPAGLVVANPRPFPAVAGAIMAGFWRGGLAYDATTRTWTGNAAWFAGSFGPISATANAPAYGQAQLLSAAATHSASGAVLPPADGDYVIMRGILRPFLDFSASFRFS